MTRPFFLNSETGGAATSRPGLGIALPFLGGATTVAPGLKPRNSSQVLAITGAAAIDNPGKTLELARKAREKPEEVLVQAFDETRVTALLAAVQTAQDDSSKPVDITAEDRVVAGAIGANPRLLAAARAAMGPAGDDARLWAVRLVEADTLERAARASSRAEALEPLDTGSSVGGTTNARLQKLEEDRDKIVVQLGEIRTAIDEIKTRLPPSPLPPTPPPSPPPPTP